MASISQPLTRRPSKQKSSVSLELGLYDADLAAILQLNKGNKPRISSLRSSGSRNVMLAALASLQKLRSQHENLSEPELLKRVGAFLLEKGEEQKVQEVAPESEWQALMERGLQYKTSLLASPEVRTTAEAGKLLGVGEAAIRKRIRTGSLFALQMPGGDDKRIPLWALDPAMNTKVTTQLLRDGAQLDGWEFYSFMTTPNGSLHGLRPFEALLSFDALGPEQKKARRELAEQFRLPANGALVPAVREALRVELEDRPKP